MLCILNTSWILLRNTEIIIPKWGKQFNKEPLHFLAALLTEGLKSRIMSLIHKINDWYEVKSGQSYPVDESLSVV